MRPEWEQKMYDFCKEAHKGQLDDEGKDYFEAHCVPVAEMLKLVKPDERELICAAYGHDLIEDTNKMPSDVMGVFPTDNPYGLNTGEIIGYILEVTHEKPSGDCLPKYFPRLKTENGILLKLLDRASNISRMRAWSDKRKQQYMRISKFWSLSVFDNIGLRELKKWCAEHSASLDIQTTKSANAPVLLSVALQRTPAEGLTLRHTKDDIECWSFGDRWVGKATVDLLDKVAQKFLEHVQEFTEKEPNKNQVLSAK